MDSEHETAQPDERREQLRAWSGMCLKEQGIADEFSFSMVSGDASFRRYFRASTEQQTFIAVDAPPATEDSETFIAVDELLRQAGVRVPEVFASDLQQGFMLLEDFGDDTYLPKLLAAQARNDSAVPRQLYGDAIAALVTLQARSNKERLDPYDRDELRREMSVFTEWMCVGMFAMKLGDEEQTLLDDTMEFLENAALSQTRVVVHRDYHSRNLLVLADGDSPGVIDFQDAVLGPYTYDLVSLLRDCYVRWPQQDLDFWADQYFAQAQASNIITGVSRAQFIRDFDLMGLQRHMKVLGVFSRLALRDNKTGYLADIPRVIHYFLEVSHRYPEMAGFLDWFQAEVMPRAREKFTLID